MPRQTVRWPRRVYDEGTEPDYRFSFANERTFLAWIRTALALLAAAVALDVVNLSMSDHVQRALGILLASVGFLAAIGAWVRWALSERAMRRGDALPPFGFGLGFAVAVVSVIVVVMLAL
ncbi:DUF202 domain-containing protein [Rhodococcus opacus]|nr:DUF202 domain-containing protein [Rhodococcus opacus]